MQGLTRKGFMKNMTRVDRAMTVPWPWGERRGGAGPGSLPALGLEMDVY